MKAIGIHLTNHKYPLQPCTTLADCSYVRYARQNPQKKKKICCIYKTQETIPRDGRMSSLSRIKLRLRFICIHRQLECATLYLVAAVCNGWMTKADPVANAP